MIPLVLVGLVVLYFWSNSGPSLPAGIASADGTPPPGAGCGGVGGFIKGHVDRKNAIAPTVISKYTGLPGGTAKSIAGVAAKLSPSGYVESFIGDTVGDALCNVSPLGAAAAGAKFAAKEVEKGVQYAVTGAKAAGSFVVKASTNPLSTATGLASKAANVSTAATNLVSSITDRGVNAVYSRLPTPLKVVAKPALVVQKVTAKVTTTAVAVGSKAASALSSGAKGAEHAISSIGHVLGF
jgi:hypothetical protein